MTWIDDYETALRDFRVPFEIRPGWRTVGKRGNWTHGKPVAQLDHHFVISYASAEAEGVRMIEQGYGGPTPPVVNQYLGSRSKLFLICAHPTGHPGIGSAAVISRAMADLPCRGGAASIGAPNDMAQATAERLLYGTEVHHPGDGTPLRDEQRETLIASNAALSQVLGWSAHRTLQHREYTDRKVDIRNDALNSDQHRADIAARLRGVAPAPVDWFTSATVLDVARAVR